MRKMTMVTVLTVLGLGVSANAGDGYHSKKSKDKSHSAEMKASQDGTNQARIKDAQRSLNTFGYNLDVDGVIGNETRTSIREFQERQNLKQTGVLDEATMAALSGTSVDGRTPASVDEPSLDESSMDESYDDQEMRMQEDTETMENESLPTER